MKMDSKHCAALALPTKKFFADFVSPRLAILTLSACNVEPSETLHQEWTPFLC
jgi:hypothetical protein